MLVRAVVVHHQVQGNVPGKLRINAPQEFQELLVTMPAEALAHDLALQNFQSGKQGGRAVALVVMGHRAQPAFLHRQAGLGAVQRLDLGLLVHTEHQRLIGRVQVQPNDIRELLQEPGIARELEGLDPVRLQIVAAPNRTDGGLAHALKVRHPPATPLGHPLRLARCGGLDDRLDLARRIGGLATAAGCDLPQALWPSFQKAATPQGDRRPAHAQRIGKHDIGPAACRTEHNAAPKRHLLRRSVSRHPPLQLLTLKLRYDQRRMAAGHPPS